MEKVKEISQKEFNKLMLETKELVTEDFLKKGISQEKLMDGADAPKEWRAGNCQKVMDYCLGDCQMTNLIIQAIQDAKQVQWVTTKGYVSSKPMPRLKTVEEIIRDTAPDQSWMDTPIPKNKFHKWIDEI